MFDAASNAVWSIAYGVTAMFCFSMGFSWAARGALLSEARSTPPSNMIDIAVLVMCIVNMIYFLPLLRLTIDYYGFSGLTDVFYDLGSNYQNKDKLIEDLSYVALGPMYTLINLAAFTQVAPYALLLLHWDKLRTATLIAAALSLIMIAFFYVSIGTMSGVFHMMTLLAGGWLVRQFLFSLDNIKTAQTAYLKRKRIIFTIGLAGIFFFVFMVIVLSSRMDHNIVVTQPFLYNYDSLIYSFLGPRLGDGFGMALSYVSQGWYGLSHSLSIDFQWTEFQSFSRVITSYVNRFAGDQSGFLPLSYPLRQEPLTGYPAYAHWHTIFPWFASDFTFAGTLLITGCFGAAYGWSWVKAIHEGCLIATTLFAQLTIGALFINANSQILDNKTLTLSLVGLLVLLPFRRRIGRIY